METRLAGKKGERNQREYFATDHLKKDLKVRALKGGGVTILSRIFDHATQLAGAVVLARLLTPEDFGLVAMVVAISGFFLMFKDLGLTDATVQSEKINQDQVSTLFWINFFFCLILTALFCLAAPLIARFYNEPRLVDITFLLSVTFILAGLSTQHIALLRRNMLFTRIAAIEMMAAFGSTVISIYLAIKGAGYWALVLRNIFLSVIVAIGAWVFCKWRPGLPVHGANVKPMVKFGANTMGFYLVNYFARNMDKALIGWKNGPIALGLYHKAFYLFVAPINQLVIPLQSVAVSALTKLRNEPEKFKRYYVKSLGYLAFIAMPMSAFIASSSEDVIVFLLGDKWIKAAEIFAILGWAAGIQILYSTQGWIYVSMGRADRWLRWGIFSSIFTVAGFFIGLPFGPKGIALAYTITLYILITPGLWYAGKLVGIHPVHIFAAVWKYYVSAAGAALITQYISSMDLSSHVSVKVLIDFCVYVGCYLALIVAVFRSINPIRQFCAIVPKVLPSVKIKKR